MLNKVNKNVHIYQKALDASWLRNTAISNNIANVNTPGYKRQDVKFDSVLKNYINSNSMELSKTHPKHFPNNTIDSMEPTVTREMGTSFRKDKNNVNIDVEMAELAKNAIKFNALTQELSNHLKRIKTAISQGGK
ncbi:flagellar basal body rod protein FlgB [Wukongibacter baidiensis]|uniref:flagellar basal body rod protein FlgB n=1 Tax=Wukongibacter baidiensis TaxID=1723361 RepID=UPI003D7F5574